MLFGRRKRSINRILVVEDEPLVAFDNEHFLQDAGYEVAGTVDRADLAVRALAAGGVDLVLSDVVLSHGGTGMEVAQAARELGVPVLFVTGNCPPEAKELAIGCLAKPYSQRDLRAAIDAVDDVLSGREPSRAPGGLSIYRSGPAEG